MIERVRLRLCMCVAMALSTTACATTGAGGGESGTGASYSPRRDERRIVGSFGDIRALAVSRRYVFAASASGIAIYDRLFNAWQAPVSPDIGLTDAQITAIAGDPVEDALWIGVPGAVIIYRPAAEQLQRTIVTGVPELIAFDRQPTGDAFVRASGQWSRVSRSGIATPVSPPVAGQVILPASLNDVYSRYPGLRSGAPLLFRSQRADRPLYNFSIQTGVYAPDQPSEVWLGTRGDGLYKVDGVTQQATAVRYGLLETGVGALALAADGVWSAGLGLSSLRSGLTFASTDLQRWRWIDGTIAVPMLGLRATSMSVRAQRAWVGTDRGVVRVQLDAAESITLWSAQHGLPDERVTAVAARDDGAWVATLRGLVFVNDSGFARTPNLRSAVGSGGVASRAGAVVQEPALQLLQNVPVYALQPVRDTLWIGTASGLMALPANGTLSRPVGDDPALRRRIVALAWSDSVLLAATDDAVLQLNPRGGHAPERITALNVASVGQITRLAIDDRTIVMTGTDGVVLLQRRGGLRVLQVPRDIPSAVLDVALARDWIWLATPAGLVRLRRASDGGLP